MNAQIAPYRHRVTIEEYAQMGAAGVFADGARVELIEGDLIDMSPIESLHASVQARLTRALTRLAGDRVLVWAQNPIRLSDHSEPQPDVALLKNRADDYARELPTATDVLLVIEVADSSLDYDRNTKIPLYARHGIPEVWLIDLATAKVEVYRQPEAIAYQSKEVSGRNDTIEIAQLTGIAIAVAELLPAG